jgi:hypothetical protein
MSTDFIGSIANMVGGPAIDALANKVGLPAEMVSKFKPVIIGLVVAGIARLLKQPGGATQMQNLIDTSSQSVGAQSPADFINNVNPDASMNLLSSLAGGNSLDNVLGNLAGKTGIDAGQLTGLLGSVAPLVLAGLGQAQKSGGLSTDQLAAKVTDGVANMPELGMIDYALDNQPGITDDIKRGFNALFGKKD